MVKISDELLFQLGEGEEPAVVQVSQDPEFVCELPQQQLTTVGVPAMGAHAIIKWSVLNKVKHCKGFLFCGCPNKYFKVL